MTTWTDLAGWTLVHFLWQGAFIGAAAALALWALRSAAAQTRYALACGALAAMLVSPLLTVWALAGDAAPPRIAAVRPAPASPTSTAAVEGAPAGASAATASPATRSSESLPLPFETTAVLSIVVALWLTGVAILLARLAGGCWRVRRLRRLALVEPPSRWQAAADAIARRLSLSRQVPIVDSASVDAPTAIGWLQPLILLPIAAMSNLTIAQVEAVLAHELAHIRRHDFLVNVLQTLAEILLFYHPAVWWISSRIRTEREHCCDDIAVDVCGDPVAYAAALTDLAAWAVSRTPLAVGATSGSLLDRVRRVLGVDRSNDDRSSVGMVMLGLAVALVVVVGGVRASSAVQAGDPAPPSSDDRRFGPPDVNRLLGFELFPVPTPWATEDPRSSRAWGVTIVHSGGEFPLIGFTARSLIRHAYGLTGTPIVEAPDWIDRETIHLTISSDTFVVNGGWDPEVMQSMLRDALEERLGLVVHQETREFPVYALVKAHADGTLGPNLEVSNSTCWDGDLTRRVFSRQFCGIDNNITGVTAEKVTMAEFAASLDGLAPLGPDRQVVDRTGLSERYDFRLRYGFLPIAAIGAGHPTFGALIRPLGFRTIFTALPEQLGLRLEESTAPFEVLVIDRMARPVAKL